MPLYKFPPRFDPTLISELLLTYLSLNLGLDEGGAGNRAISGRESQASMGSGRGINGGLAGGILAMSPHNTGSGALRNSKRAGSNDNILLASQSPGCELRILE